MAYEEHSQLDSPKVVKLQPTWKNAPTYDDMYADYFDANDSFEEYRTKLLNYKDILDGGRKIKAKTGKSNARPKLVRKNNEWRYAALEAPFLNTQDMFDIQPRTFEDAEAAEQNGIILNYQWATKVDKTELVGSIVRGLVDEGTVIVKTGWEVEEDTVLIKEEQPVYASPEQSYELMQAMVLSGKMTKEEMATKLQNGEPLKVGTKTVEVEKTILTKNNPTYEVCDLRNVVIDPTALGKVDDARFIIHEYDTDMSTLKENEFTEIVHTDPETGEETVETFGVYHNLDDINVTSADYNKEYYNDYGITGENGETNFEFKDKPRRKLRAYEYWG
jgi:hypothetical protein